MFNCFYMTHDIIHCLIIYWTIIKLIIYWSQSQTAEAEYVEN